MVLIMVLIEVFFYG